MAKWFSVILSFVLIVCWLTCLSHATTPVLSSRHEDGGDLTITIDLSIGKKRSVSHVKKETNQDGQPKIDSLSKKAASIIEISVSSKDATQISEDILILANEIRNKFNKVGEFMSGPVAKKLEKWNMKSLASISKNTGGSISTYSKKLEPYEQKAAKFIAPVVKSKSFQVVKKSVNVVSGVLGIHGGLKSLHLIKGGGVKLPTNFAALKKSLSTSVAQSKKLIQNAKTFVNSSGKLTKVVGASKQALKTAGRVAKMNAVTFKRMSTWNKIKHVDGLKGAYDSVNDFKTDYSNVKKYVANRSKKNQASGTNKKQQVSSRNNSRNSRNTKNNSNRNNVVSSRSTSSRTNNNSNRKNTNSRNTVGQRSRSSSGRNSSKPSSQRKVSKSNSTKKKGGG
ncbi:predicted protein [Naegleria gruberi]|uniref:Predicted protein n=1 Tax=Naegleria gruberi TaxID=5762 RepID=D2VBX2_NAEGR|nr:uncharacterized protein NAEGRDRAFT_48300 [Naegleria gruberi]EFC45652.1 predicted protein [Naegleria gruberi]|eukprot:XP_002678396.1 predicted protein [Naegleria gruberi strain NEG-M]